MAAVVLPDRDGPTSATAPGHPGVPCVDASPSMATRWRIADRADRAGTARDGAHGRRAASGHERWRIEHGVDTKGMSWQGPNHDFDTSRKTTTTIASVVTRSTTVTDQ